MNKLTAITMALLLASCSDESSNEALSFPEDMHANDRAIATTANMMTRLTTRVLPGLGA